MVIKVFIAVIKAVSYRWLDIFNNGDFKMLTVLEMYLLSPNPRAASVSKDLDSETTKAALQEEF